MKKQVVFLKSLIGVLPFLFFGTACSESDPEQSDPFLTIQEADKTIALPTEGDIKTIQVETNISDWSVSVDAENSSWCTVSKEKNTIVISTPKNEGVERTAKITVKAESIQNLNVEITVIQAGDPQSDPFLTIQEVDKAISFTTNAATKTITVQTNISDWSVSVEAINSSWCTAEKVNNTIVISVSKNEEAAARTAKVSVKAGNNQNLDVEITVTQAAAIPLPTSTNFAIAGYEDQTITINFVGNETQSLTLDGAGKGVLEPANSVRTIKSIQVSEGSEILIGRQEPAGDINLVVNGSHAVQWRTKAGDATTALIGTAAELLLRFNNSSATTYEFESDIDLMDQQWEPVATLTNKTIEGKNYKIYNFNIVNRATHTGLFVTISGSTIKNLHIASGNINITGTSTTSYVGAFVGNIPSSAVAGEIIGCSNAANITTDSGCAAGICGYVSNINIKFTACANFGNINGGTGARVGGIVNSNSSIITACYNTGTITGGQYTGGVAGYFGSTTCLYATFNTGTVVSSNVDKGAVCGRYTANLVDTQIVNCFYDVASCEKEQFASLIVPFSSEKWPGATDQYWGIGNDPATGKYWNSVGRWNGGTPTYPTLYWE